MRTIRLLLDVMAENIDRSKVIGKALSTSVLNQIVSSGTNFMFGVYLVRTLTPEEFGLYGIGFAISLFYSGTGNALFLMQMLVHFPDKAPGESLSYASRMFFLTASFCSATLLLFALLLLTGSLFWETIAHQAQFACAVMVASCAYLLKEFFVRHAYNVRRETWALAIHGAIACTMAILLFLQYWLITHFTVEMALWIYAASQASGALVGYVFAKLPIASQKRNALLGDLREALHGGKWASITNLVYFARIHTHTIVVAALLGPVGVAKLNAARLLVTPAVMLTPALSQVAMPRLASEREKGVRRLTKLGLLITSTLLAVALLYSAILLGGYDFIADKILGDKYQDLFLIIVLWCFYTCLLALRNGAEMVGQVLKKFRNLSSANTYSAIVSLIATYWLTVGYGLPGALIGLASGEITLIVLLYYLLLATMPTNQLSVK